MVGINRKTAPVEHRGGNKMAAITADIDKRSKSELFNALSQKQSFERERSERPHQRY